MRCCDLFVGRWPAGELYNVVQYTVLRWLTYYHGSSGIFPALLRDARYCTIPICIFCFSPHSPSSRGQCMKNDVVTTSQHQQQQQRGEGDRNGDVFEDIIYEVFTSVIDINSKETGRRDASDEVLLSPYTSTADSRRMCPVLSPR